MNAASPPSATALDPRNDPRDFRQALGMFATGVTIVTTRDTQGVPVGLTANSFNSVSLQPPMVLWSLARTARSLPAFGQATHWNVHVLSEAQEALSNRFARPGEDKFAGLVLEPGQTDAPLLPGCSARFQCRAAFQYDGGDHVIFVGEVIAYDRREMPPLLYVTGGYALAAPKAGSVATLPGAPVGESLYTEDLLGYLLGRAHHQFMAGFRHVLAERALNDGDFFVLSTLSARQPLSAADIALHVATTGIDIGPVALQALCARGLLACVDGGYRMTDAGHDAIWHVLAAAKAVEAQVTDRLGEHNTALLRNQLKRVISATDPGLPPLWQLPT